jgi:type IV pilus assembly protein PilV
MNEHAGLPGRADGHKAVAAGQRGSTLTEVLVTVAIVTLGFAATVDLQTTALRLNHSAYLRTQAVVLSSQILDSMRANRTAASDGEYDRGFGDAPPAADAAMTPARRDLRAWLMNVENRLRPYQGAAAISRFQNRFVISIRWQERGTSRLPGTAEPEVVQFDTVAEL